VSSETPKNGPAKPPIPTPAKKIPAMNIEKRGDRLYEINYLHKWFAISSLLLFLFTVAMVLVDYAREWKRYQRAFNRITIERTQQDIQKAVSSIDRAKYDQLEQQIQQARADQQKNEGQIDEVQKKINDLTAKQFAVNQNYQFEKAIYDAEKYAYEEAIAYQRSNSERLKQRLDETAQKMNDYKAQVDQVTIDLKAANADLAKFIGKRDEAQKSIDTMLTEYTRLETRLKTLNPGLVVTSFRNAPVFDFMNPSERINQILLPNLFYEHPFKNIPRVDRCTTCHQGIDQKAYENAPQPFKTHPNMDLYLAASSPHPMESFGCTTCHAGLDRAVDFQTAGHSPRSEEQRQEWVNKYGWHEEHYLETPMLPMNQIQAGCYKCHNASTNVPKADALNNGRDLIRIYGCFGCHKIPGYESVRKVGPDLSTVSGKVSKEWVRKWLSNPKEFKSEARMPQFWWNSNNSGPQFDKRNLAEINAIAEYLFSKSTPKQLPPAPASGNTARGKEIVESVGCFGCHAVGPIQEVPNQSQTRRKHGYNLQNLGSKVQVSWIYNWVKDPQKVWPDTKMPSLRLTDEEAADVAAYLSSLKNPEFDSKPLPEVDSAALDEVALELLKGGSTEIEAREKMKTMSSEQKNLFAGERLISRYGCFGCHNIPGFENAQPIGTELTEAGTKLISQLDFGFLNIEHSRHAWYEEKLKDPRIFDVGRVKRPEELLKMPNFHFKDDEINSIAMVLVSLVKDRVPLEMRDRTVAAISEGRALIAEKNCRGCHIIEGSGGDIRATFKDVALTPPNLATEGFKTQPFWLHPFLLDPGKTRLRPWLTVRMPTFHFTEQQSATIGRYFAAVDKVDYPFISTEVATTSEKLNVGAELFTKLQCASCHPTSSTLPPGKEPADLAPNLMLAHDRLRPEWILQWLADPQKIFPGTRMPTFFPEGQSPLKDILGGNAKAQIEAVRDHVFLTLGGGRRAPAAATTKLERQSSQSAASR
jgi:mono/diheme cytochrome c family protein/phage shock protein A